MIDSDEELWVASVGDEEPFAAFYRRYARPLAGCTGRGDVQPRLQAVQEKLAVGSGAPRRDGPENRH